jgi:hypothetical protein
MKDSVTIDLRQTGKIRFLVDPGVQYAPSITLDDQTLDSGYTLTIAGNTYTVGSGLALDAPTKTIIWNLDTTGIAGGEYEGELISDSKVSGVYLKIDIVMVVTS